MKVTSLVSAEQLDRIHKKSGLSLIELQQQLETIEKAFDYFRPKYGNERTLQILMKVFPYPKHFTYLDVIGVGEKWHLANLLFNGKISDEEFEKKFPKMG